MIKRILSLGHSKGYLKETLLFEKGRSCNRIYYINKGIVLLRFNQHSSFHFLSKGVFLGVTEVILNSPYSSEAIALPSAELIVIDADKVIQLLNQEAAVQGFLLQKIIGFPTLNFCAFE